MAHIGSVLLFLPDLNGGGAERAVINLARVWSRRAGLALYPKIVVRRLEGPFVSDLPAEVPVHSLGTARSGLLASMRSALSLAALVRREHPAALVSFLSHPSASLAKRLSGNSVPFIASVQNPIALSLRQSGGRSRSDAACKVQMSLLRRSFSNVDLFLPISAGIGDELTKEFGIAPSSIAVLPNSVDLENVGLGGTKRLSKRAHADELPLLVTAGRLVYQKGLDVLIEAVRRLRDEGCAVRLQIFGEGPDRPLLEKQVLKFGLRDSISFEGFSNTLATHLARADVFVLASRYEGFGNVLVEAMACGIPVVSTAAPHGPSEILANGEYGVLVPVESADALAQAIARLIGDDDERLRLSRLGKRRASDYGAERIFDCFYEKLSEVVSTPRPT